MLILVSLVYMKTLKLILKTPYSLNWEFVDSQNKIRNVFELNMDIACGGKEWLFYKVE